MKRSDLIITCPLLGARFAHEATLAAAGLSTAANAANSILSTISTSAQNHAQRRMARQMFESQKVENQKNRDWQEMMWEKEAAYNTPAAQAARLLEAGINPQVAMSDGAGQTGNVSSAPAPASNGLSPVVPSAVTPNIGIGNLGESMNQFLDAFKKAKELPTVRPLLDAQLENLTIDAVLKNFENDINIIYGYAKSYGEANKVIEESHLAAQNYLNAIKDGELKDGEKALQDLQKEFRKLNNKQFEQQMPVILRNLERQGELLASQSKAAAAQANYFDVQSVLTDEQKEMMKSMNFAEIGTKLKSILGDGAGSVVTEILRVIRNSLSLSAVIK